MEMARLFSCLVLLLLGTGTAANASAILLSIFDFTGTCSDCTGSVSAVLTLSNYTLGSNITTSNFVTLTYNGSNLLSPFTITDAEVIADGEATGSIGPVLPGSFPVAVIRFDSSDAFESQFAGNWCAGSSCDRDAGGNGIWSVATTPEPASIATFLVGIAGFVSARARRSKRV
jgi:hypothetical protein